MHTTVGSVHKLTPFSADKLADYEDELDSLKASRSRAVTPTSGGSLNRFSSLLNLRRAPPSPPLDKDMSECLESERTLRREAEAKLNAVTAELEELSASLFQQANEMVAEERRARGKLEARVRVLEEREKRNGQRLEDLERAVERIERVRGVLGKS